jgi:hypothetical protein
MYAWYIKVGGSNNVSSHKVYSCKVYEDFDHCWHQSTTIMKHVAASNNGSEVGFGIEEVRIIVIPPMYIQK